MKECWICGRTEKELLEIFKKQLFDYINDPELTPYQKIFRSILVGFDSKYHVDVCHFCYYIIGEVYSQQLLMDINAKTTDQIVTFNDIEKLKISMGK